MPSFLLGNEAVASEVKSLFGSPSSSSSTPQNESFATRAEHLCNRVLSMMTSGTSRRYRRSAPYSRVRNWTKNVVLIDWQGDNSDDAELDKKCRFN